MSAICQRNFARGSGSWLKKGLQSRNPAQRLFFDAVLKAIRALAPLSTRGASHSSSLNWDAAAQETGHPRHPSSTDPPASPLSHPISVLPS